MESAASVANISMRERCRPARSLCNRAVAPFAANGSGFLPNSEGGPGPEPANSDPHLVSKNLGNRKRKVPPGGGEYLHHPPGRVRNLNVCQMNK